MLNLNQMINVKENFNNLDNHNNKIVAVVQAMQEGKQIFYISLKEC